MPGWNLLPVSSGQLVLADWFTELKAAIDERVDIVGGTKPPAIASGSLINLDSYRDAIESLMGKLWAKTGTGDTSEFFTDKADIMNGLFGTSDWPNKDKAISASHFNDMYTVINALTYDKIEIEEIGMYGIRPASGYEYTKDDAQNEYDSCTTWYYSSSWCAAGIDATYYPVVPSGYSVGAFSMNSTRARQAICSFNCPSYGIDVVGACLIVRVKEQQEDAVLGYVAPTTNSVFTVYGDDEPLPGYSDESTVNGYGTEVAVYAPEGRIGYPLAWEMRCIELDSIAPFTVGQDNYLRIKGKSKLNLDLSPHDWGDGSPWLTMDQWVRPESIFLALDFAYR